MLVLNTFASTFVCQRRLSRQRSRSPLALLDALWVGRRVTVHLAESVHRVLEVIAKATVPAVVLVVDLWKRLVPRATTNRSSVKAEQVASAVAVEAFKKRLAQKRWNPLGQAGNAFFQFKT